MRLKAFLLIVFYEVCSTLGQVAFKKSARKFSAAPLGTARDYLAFLRRIIVMPGIWWGIIITAVGTVSWLVALAHVDLSLAMPLNSAHYLIVLLASYVLLRERMDRMRVMGTVLVVAGIALVAFS